MNNNSISSYTPKRPTKKKVPRNPDETVTDEKYIKLASIMKKDMSNYDSYHASEPREKLTIPNHIRQGLRRKEKLDPTALKNETINFTEQAEGLTKQLAA